MDKKNYTSLILCMLAWIGISTNLLAQECSQVEFNRSNFETTLGIWNEDGSDSDRVYGDGANGSNFSASIRDNSSSSNIYTNDLNLSGVTEVEFIFDYKANDMEEGEDFVLEYSLNGGIAYSTIQQWVSGIDFENGVYTNQTVSQATAFTANTVFRFRCDASSNSDVIYIDDVIINVCGAQYAGIPVCNYALNNDSDFDSGFGFWQDGGSSCELSSDGANGSAFSVKLVDDKVSSSSIITTSQDFSSAQSVQFDFMVKFESMEFGEDLFLEYSDDGGNSYDKKHYWISGQNLSNSDTYINQVVEIEGPFATNSVFRFRCDASSKYDRVFLDDIKVSSCGNVIIGTDADGDGFYADEDCDDNNALVAQEGDSCNDGNPLTGNDVILSDCSCAGTAIEVGDCTFNEYSNSTFESNFGIWNDGGSDCQVNFGNGANNSNFSIRLRDNSSGSDMYTNTLNLAGITEVEFDFDFKASSMEVGEDFFLEYSLDGGDTYQIIEQWVSGTDFVNGPYNDAAVNFAAGFTSTTRFRFRCDASSNYDRIYIDNVVINICQDDIVVGDCNYLVENNYDWESGYGFWRDGGSSCERYYDGGANGSDRCVRLKDNDGSSSSTYTKTLDYFGVDKAELDFMVRFESMEPGEDLILEYSVNGGGNYQAARTWVSGQDINNSETFVNQVVEIQGPFSAETKFRFRCDASSSLDRVYLDDILLSSCTGGTGSGSTIATASFKFTEEASNIEEEISEDAESTFVVYPNPAINVVNLDLENFLGLEVKVSIFDIRGLEVATRDLGLLVEPSVSFDMTNVVSGTYIARVLADGEIENEKFIVIKK